MHLFEKATTHLKWSVLVLPSISCLVSFEFSRFFHEYLSEIFCFIDFWVLLYPPNASNRLIPIDTFFYLHSPSHHLCSMSSPNSKKLETRINSKIPNLTRFWISKLDNSMSDSNAISLPKSSGKHYLWKMKLTPFIT